ncbi:MAG: hypothetical protein CL842_09215 [Crocinitomicaceae bacterium]|nr:hypothetical protein [Crocinitomicaceae bacterium]|tara:strand:+ start:262744 stop:263943 length:1200 start_codon:yes stop_codon:yes gene_type:complete
MKHLFLLGLIIVTFLSKPVIAQPINLSPDAKISLLTCGPGNDLYSIFGHTAIRIKDQAQNIDAAFNYGTFAFSEDFYFQFTMGKLNYRLAIEPYSGFVASYQYENRWVREQILNLDSTQKQQAFEFLINNAKPENSYYLYDFFYDNCSTRPREVFENVLGDQLKFNFLALEKEKTFRNMIDLYLRQMPWSDAGIDLGLGTPCDKVCTPKLKTFLPDYLMDEFDRATIITEDGEISLVSENKLIVDARPFVEEGFKWFHPIVLFLAFIILHELILMTKVRFLIGTFDGLLYTALGVAGCLIFFLWFITDHNGTRPNWNILWAMPLYFPFGIAYLIAPKVKILNWMMHGINALLLLCLLFWAILPQNLNEFYLPIVVWLFYRNSDRLGWFKMVKNRFRSTV